MLDGIVFRTHVRAWRAPGFRTSFVIYRASVFLVALISATLLLFAPLYIAIELAPRLAGRDGAPTAMQRAVDRSVELRQRPFHAPAAILRVLPPGGSVVSRFIG